MFQHSFCPLWLYHCLHKLLNCFIWYPKMCCRKCLQDLECAASSGTFSVCYLYMLCCAVLIPGLTQGTSDWLETQENCWTVPSILPHELSLKNKNIGSVLYIGSFGRLWGLGKGRKLANVCSWHIPQQACLKEEKFTPLKCPHSLGIAP